MKPTSREARICLAIWRKVWRERDLPEPVTIHAKDFSTAVNLRQTFYRTIRPYRQGEAYDPELSNACEYFIAYLDKQPDPKSPHRIIFRKRLTLTELESELSSLGLDEEDLLLPSERRASEALDELLESPKRSTPFYTRD